MKRWPWLKCAIYLSVLALTLTSVGCWNPFDPGGGGNGNHKVGDRRSPDHLLEFFATAYEDKSIERYEESLDLSYTFTFMEADWGRAEVPPDRPYWGLTEDLPRTTAMFIDEKTGAISFDFRPAVADWFACTEIVWTGSDWDTLDAVCCSHDPVIDVTVNYSGEEPTTYQVRSSRVEITAIEDRFNPELWTILKIKEFPKE